MTTPVRFFICGRNLVDEANITGSASAVSTLPLSNLKLSSRARVWRSSSDAEQDLVFDFEPTTSVRVNFVAMLRHNLETNGTWKNQLFSDYTGGGGSPASSLLYAGTTDYAIDYATLGDLDFGVDDLGGGSYSGFLGQRNSVQYFMQNTASVVNSVRTTITDTGNSANYVEASRFYIGRGFELTHGASKIDLSWKEDTTQHRTDGGSLLSDGSLAWREMEIEAKLTSAERAELMDMFRWAGMRKDLFVSGFPGVGGEKERDYMMMCRFKEMPRISAQIEEHSAGVYPCRFTLVEG